MTSPVISYDEIDLPAITPNPSGNFVTHTVEGGTMRIDCPGGSDVVNWSSTQPIALGEGCTSTVLTTNTTTFQTSRHNLDGIAAVQGTSDSRIGLCELAAGGMAVAWADWTNNGALNFAASDRSLNWFAPVATSETSVSGVDLAQMPGNDANVQFAWTATDGAGTVNFATGIVLPLPFSSTQELELTKQVLSPQTALGTTALGAGASGSAWVAWTGTDSNNSLNLMGPFGGGDTPEQSVLVNDNSKRAPRLCVMDGTEAPAPVTNSEYRLGHAYLSWVGTDANSSLNVLQINLGDYTGTKWVLAQPSRCAPALLPLGAAGSNQWYMAWIDLMTSHVALAWCPNPDMHNWQMMTLFGAQAWSTGGVTLALDPVGQQLVVAYTDMNLALNVATLPLDPTQW